MAERNDEWRRSSASVPFNDCVEVLAKPENVRVRDSKGNRADELAFTPVMWGGFVAALRGVE